jgi:hypothetical protein
MAELRAKQTPEQAKQRREEQSRNMAELRANQAPEYVQWQREENSRNMQQKRKQCLNTDFDKEITYVPKISAFGNHEECISSFTEDSNWFSGAVKRGNFECYG